MMQALLAIPFFAMSAVAALAQANPTGAEPTLGDRLGGWLPFLLILVVAFIIYRVRKGRNADPTRSGPPSQL